MTIGSELSTVSTSASNIKQEVTDKGQTVTSTDSWLNVVEKIDKLKADGEDYTQNLLQEVLAGTVVDIYDTTLAYIRPSCFRNCEWLQRAEFTNITKICANAFRSCYRFNTLILPGVFVKLDNSNAFQYTQITKGGIYVADTLVNTYKSAAGWSTYASSIKALSTYVDDSLLFDD